MGLHGPEDVAVLPGGDLVVTSHYSDEILRVRADGASSRVFSSIEAPVGVTVGLDGHVYAASYSKHAVVRYDGETGEFMDYFATGGFLQGPSSLTFASTRLLYVSSYENNRLVLYNASTRMSFTVPMRARSRVHVSS
jgi:streptogramin lyase